MQRIGLVIAGIAAACMVATAPAGAATRAAAKPPKHVSILFLVQSKGATFTPLGKGAYQIRLTGTRSAVYAFTDRPARMANHGTMLRLIRFWTHSDFVAVPPNGSLVLTAPDGTQTTVVATLSKPRWDKRAHAFTLHAQLLRDITSGDYSYYPSTGTAVLGGSYTQVRLFIDSIFPTGLPVPTSHPVMTDSQTVTLSRFGYKFAQATCPEGYYPYTGYYSIVGDSSKVTVNQYPQPGDARTWEMDFFSNASGNVTITYAAYCLPNG